MVRPAIRHALQLVAMITLALACMFYPFMPGTHDRLAVTLSAMSQVLGLTGVLMVPIGILWLIHDLVLLRRRRRGLDIQRERGTWFALCAMATSAVMVAGVAFAAATHTGASLALVVLTLSGYLLRRGLTSVRRLRTAGHSGVNVAPLYLILVPCSLVLAQQLWLPSAVEFGRRRAIAGSQPFIDAIEGYRAAHGRYPVSLASVHHDYDPPTVGIEQYRYEPHGEGYNVFFEHPASTIGTQEFVMYNPAGQHVMMVHNRDLLEAGPEQVAQERAFHARAARDAGVRHWKYFWFD